MEKQKKYLKPEAEVIELPDIETVIDTSVPDFPLGLGGDDGEEDFQFYYAY